MADQNTHQCLEGEAGEIGTGVSARRREAQGFDRRFPCFQATPKFLNCAVAVAVVLWALGVIGDLLAAQRVMTQRTFERIRRIALQLGVEPSHYEPGAPMHAAADAPLARDRAQQPVRA